MRCECTAGGCQSLLATILKHQKRKERMIEDIIQQLEQLRERIAQTKVYL